MINEVYYILFLSHRLVSLSSVLCLSTYPASFVVSNSVLSYAYAFRDIQENCGYVDEKTPLPEVESDQLRQYHSLLKLLILLVPRGLV